MAKHAELLRPRFEAVDEILNRELAGLEIGQWTKPQGGYFVSFDALDGCAKAIVAKCKEAGVVMTGAGATFPYGKDPHDSNIRIAPVLPVLRGLKAGCRDLLCMREVSEHRQITGGVSVSTLDKILYFSSFWDWALDFGPSPFTFWPGYNKMREDF